MSIDNFPNIYHVSNSKRDVMSLMYLIFPSFFSFLSNVFDPSLLFTKEAILLGIPYKGPYHFLFLLLFSLSFALLACLVGKRESNIKHNASVIKNNLVRHVFHAHTYTYMYVCIYEGKTNYI